MALDLCQNFVSAQYLENKLTELHQIFIYAFILTRSIYGLLHIIFHRLVSELWPLIYARILFLLNILITNGQILTNLYITILTRSRFGLLAFIFRKFVP